MTPLQQDVIIFLYRHDIPQTGINVADHFKIEHQTYGRQRATSTAIAGLRRLGLIRDVKRCPVCHRALTRGLRNVPLKLTARGLRAARTLIFNRSAID